MSRRNPVLQAGGVRGGLVACALLFLASCGRPDGAVTRSAEEADPQATRAYWQALVANLVADPAPPAVTSVTAPDTLVDAVIPGYLRRNQLITMNYARLFEETGARRFFWGGLAAYASHMVGGQIRARSAVPPDAESGVLHRQVAAALGIGNTGVYYDIYWQHLAYQAGGLPLMQRLAANGELPAEVLPAWEAMARGDAGGDVEAYWDATQQIAYFEQHSILQPRVFAGPLAWTAGLFFSGQVTSPVPGGRSFTKFMGSGSNVSNFDQRWEWIRGATLTEWRTFVETKSQDLSAGITRMARGL
jgi:hypothetical protein